MTMSMAWEDKDLDAFNAVKSVYGKPSKVPSDDVVFSQRLVDIDDLGEPGTYKPELPSGNYAEGCTFVNTGILGKFEAKPCTFEHGKPAEPDPEPDGRITIQITNGAPVRIDPAEWPVVAFGDAGDEFIGSKFEGCAIVVRENVSDGRTVAEGAYVCDGEEDIVVGGISYWKVDGVRQDGLANNIKEIASFLGTAYGGWTGVIRRAAEKAFASIPAVDL